MSHTAEPHMIQNDHEYYAIQATLTRQNRPHAVLRFLMGFFESYRAARKIGWSRSWNKYGVTNFQSFQLNMAQDAAWLNLAQEILATSCPDIPALARTFLDSLFTERDKLRGFLFVQEYTENGRRFEGANFSLGRRAAGQSRYRDRLDMILESPIADGTSQGLARLRIFVDPYTGTKDPLWSTVVEPVHSPAAMTLFSELAQASWEWATDAERLWDHWTSAYIDYFGPRQWPVQKSYFYVPQMPTARIMAAPDTTPTRRAVEVVTP